MRLIGGGKKRPSPLFFFVFKDSQKNKNECNRTFQWQGIGLKKKTTVCYCFGPVLNSMNKSQITGRRDSFNTRLRLRALINRQVCVFVPLLLIDVSAWVNASQKKKKKNLIHRFTHGLINHFTANRKICTGAFLARELTFAEAVISTRALLFRAHV